MEKTIHKMIYRVTCLCLCLCMMMGQTIQVFADTEEERIAAEEALQAEKDALYHLPVQSNERGNWPAGPQTYAQSSIVMDVESGAILYAKNVDEILYPASITKLVTALVALENANLTDRVQVTQESVSFLEWNYAQIGLRPGEEISMEEALYATLLKSANEAAYVVAENTKDGYDWFITEMNRRFEEVGAQNSHFTNPHGLHDDQHYTTTRDMALISAELFAYPEAFEIMQTAYCVIPPTNVDPEEKPMLQNHKMLQPEHAQFYEYATGGKTGFTDQAQTTLVTFASRGDKHLVCVTMKSWAINVYEDTRNLLEYGFENFEKVMLPRDGLPEEVASVEEDAYVMLPSGITLQDLENTIVRDTGDSNTGTITYTYEGQEVGRANIAFQALSETEIEITEQAQEEEEESKTSFLWFIGIAVGIIVIFIIFLIWIEMKKREMRRRRRRRRKRRPRRYEKP